MASPEDHTAVVAVHERGSSVYEISKTLKLHREQGYRLGLPPRRGTGSPRKKGIGVLLDISSVFLDEGCLATKLGRSQDFAVLSISEQKVCSSKHKSLDSPKIAQVIA
ncbi:hypothetical protein Y032_0057g2772 [Ancylostoma ceylanicum]|uniref:Uncharacterized protein n=1 Tax=Ancylostoma ceylanicum TaxID=53326 RepID=A0A016U5L0_9BILA|nr:hypothetical protein Y032_0057g2772 [Ancylostoma ceylanicum]